MGLYTAELHATAAESATSSITFASTAKAKGKLTFGGTGSDNESGSSSSQGDTVTISEEARTKASTDVGKASKTDEAEETKTSAEKTKEKILKRIKEIQKRIQELQADSTMDEDKKRTEIQVLQSQVMQLMNQISQQSAGEYKGGTVAKGAAKSLT